MKTFSDGKIKAMGGAVKMSVIGALLAIGMAQSATADTTYTYAGNPMVTLTGSGCPTGNPITGSFTLPTAISDNSTVEYGYPFPGSFDFTACGFDYSSTSLGPFDINVFSITTDSAGVPMSWFIQMSPSGIDAFVQIVNEPSSFRFGAGCYDYGDLKGNTAQSTCAPAPGTWTVTSTSPTPEPGTGGFMLIGIGLLGLMAVMRKP